MNDADCKEKMSFSSMRIIIKGTLQEVISPIIRITVKQAPGSMDSPDFLASKNGWLLGTVVD